MFKNIPIRGSIINSITVLIGTLIGLNISQHLELELKNVAIAAVGLLVLGIGAKMFTETKNILSVALSISLGGILGKVIGIDAALYNLSEAAKHIFGNGDHRFGEAFLTTSVLYCFGPLALMGCVQEGVSKKIDLLSVKSVIDGIFSLFFAATMGAGVILTSLFVLVFQGSITLTAKFLKPYIKIKFSIEDISGVGGLLLFSIAFGILGIKKIPTECFVPAFLFVPLFSSLLKKI